MNVMVNKKFLCLVVDKDTRKCLKEYPCIEAEDFWFARHIARTKFETEHPEMRNVNWGIDSLELTEDLFSK
jgi:hypothetical protein